MHSADLKGAIQKKEKKKTKKLHRSRDTKMWKLQLTSCINDVFAVIHLLTDLPDLVALLPWDDVKMKLVKTKELVLVIKGGNFPPEFCHLWSFSRRRNIIRNYLTAFQEKTTDELREKIKIIHNLATV